MKKIIYAIWMIILFSTPLCAEPFKSPDIVVDSNLDFDWSELLVKKVRRLLYNYGQVDPFNLKIQKPILLGQNLLSSYMPQSSQDLIRDLGDVIGLSILNAETTVTLHGLTYDLKGFSSDLKASQKDEDGLIVASDFSASELVLTADKVTFTIAMPVKNSITVNAIPIMEIAIINPIAKASRDKIVHFFAKLKIQDLNDHYKLNIIDSNFDAMTDSILAQSGIITLDYEKIDIPEVELKIGNKTVKIDNQRIIKILKDNHLGLKDLLIAQAADVLRKGLGETILKTLEKYQISKEYWLDSTLLKSQILISQFSGSFDRNNIAVSLPGDFCTQKKFTELQKDCLTNKTTPVVSSRLSENHFTDSMIYLKNILESGEANLVASISEDYINKLLVATYDAGLWDKSLSEVGVSLGGQKVFIRLDRVGGSGSLFMDVVYTPTKMEKILTGSKEIRFPLVLDVALRIEKNEGIPYLIIHLNDIDMSDETLTEGRPDVDLVSSVKDIPRFKGKFLKGIKKKLVSLRDKDIFTFKYPQLSGLGLEHIIFNSDGKGRMNATLKLQSLLDEEKGLSK